MTPRLRRTALLGAALALVAHSPCWAWRGDVGGSATEAGVVVGTHVDRSRDVLVAANGDQTPNDPSYLGPIVAKLRAGDGTEIWHRQLFSDVFDEQGGIVASAMDATGDLIVHFNRFLISTNLNTSIIVKLANDDGHERWRYENPFPGSASGVAIDPQGNVLALNLVGSGPNGFGRLIKLDRNGAFLWGTNLSQYPSLVLADSHGDAIVGASATSQSYIAKHRGSDGAELWKRPNDLWLETMTTDALDAVIAVGSDPITSCNPSCSPSGLLVVKLSSATGTPQWQRHATGDAVGGSGSAVIADRLGNVIAGGSVSNQATGGDFVVAKWDSNGNPLWQRDAALNSSDPLEAGLVQSLAHDSLGNIVAGGYTYHQTLNTEAYFVLTLSASDGSQLWRQPIVDIQPLYRPQLAGAPLNAGLLADTAGNVLVAGSGLPANSPTAGPVVEKLVADDGSDFFAVCGNQILEPDEGCDDGNVVDGDGCSAGCQATESLLDVPTTGGVPITSDGEADGATPADPIETSVTTPAGGAVSIIEGPGSGGAIGVLYQLLGLEVVLTAPVATPGAPLLFVFSLDYSAVPSDGSRVEVFRNGAIVSDCTGAPGTASPDPCVATRTSLADGDLEIAVRTSAASVWNFGVPRGAAPISKCNAAKKKCLGKYVAAVMSCHAKAEAKGLPVTPDCVTKAAAKLTGAGKGCFDKADSKNATCSALGDASTQLTSANEFVDSAVGDIDPGYPAPMLSKCQAAEKKCVGSKVAALLSCDAKANKTASVDPACVAKARAKFSNVDGKGCFDTALAKGTDCGPANAGTMQTKSDTWAGSAAVEIDEP